MFENKNIKVRVLSSCQVGSHKLPATVNVEGKAVPTCALLPDSANVRKLINAQKLTVAARNEAVNLDLVNDKHSSKSKS